MSRGLGKIERAILDNITIAGPSSVLIHSWGLLCDHNCFRRPAFWNFEPTAAELKAVTRAMRSFVRSFRNMRSRAVRSARCSICTSPPIRSAPYGRSSQSSARSSSRGRKRWPHCPIDGGTVDRRHPRRSGSKPRRAAPDYLARGKLSARLILTTNMAALGTARYRSTAGRLFDRTNTWPIPLRLITGNPCIADILSAHLRRTVSNIGQTCLSDAAHHP